MLSERDESILVVDDNPGLCELQRPQLEQALREAQGQLHQAQKMEALGVLAGGIAHDFNNMILAIREYTRFAMDAMPPSEQCRCDLEQVLKATDRVAALTRQLLNFSRRDELQKSLLDPKELVLDAIQMLHPLIGEQIELEVSLDDELGALQGDACLLQQMLVNLCLNARDAMPAGGQLRLRVQRVELSSTYCDSHAALRPGPHVLLTVSDTGCGMPPEVRERIFEPFFTTKEVGKGTGLGLSMAHGVVKQHGGEMNVYSEPGVGTVIKIHLPAVPASAGCEQPAQPYSGGGCETILVAEDDRMVRDVMVRILQNAGYSVITACDGEAALRAVHEHAEAISLVLLDLVMPKLMGQWVYQGIMQLKPELPVVLCTAYGADVFPIEPVGEQRLMFVAKPFDPDVLLRTVRESLDTMHFCQRN